MGVAAGHALRSTRVSTLLLDSALGLRPAHELSRPAGAAAAFAELRTGRRGERGSGTGRLAERGACGPAPAASTAKRRGRVARAGAAVCRHAVELSPGSDPRASAPNDLARARSPGDELAR